MAEIHNKKRAGVPSRLTKWARGGVRRLSAGGAAGRLAQLRARLAGKSLRKIVIFSDGLSDTSEQQIQPLVRYRQSIAVQLGFVFEFHHVDQIGHFVAKGLQGYSGVGLKLVFNTPPAMAKATATTLFDAARSVGARCLVFDGDDDPCVHWPEVIDASDAVIKKHRFADLNAYRRRYVGKTNLTEYCNKTFGVDFSNDTIPFSGPLSDAQIDKIILGWNIALDDKIFRLSRDVTRDVLAWPKSLDISCRASFQKHVWMYGMRHAAVEALVALKDKFRVFAPTDRVGQQAYYREMLESRFTVSPFGCGELCWRDFEAFLCGSVLIKPDMSHIESWPDLFVAGETYVPVAWDYSDLETACKELVADEPARLAIATNARDKVLEALNKKAFLQRLDDTMRAAGLG